MIIIYNKQVINTFSLTSGAVCINGLQSCFKSGFKLAF